MNMNALVIHAARDCHEAMGFLTSDQATTFICAAATVVAEAFAHGGKLLIAGNGGSLCDAAHCAEELTGCFRTKRPALPAIVLSEVGHLTCVANDFGFDQVFARGVEALGRKGDVFMALSTSGNSANLMAAVSKARELSLTTICLLGRGGGRLAGLADVELVVPRWKTSDRIQEVHMACLHIMIEAIEVKLFGSIS